MVFKLKGGFHVFGPDVFESDVFESDVFESDGFGPDTFGLDILGVDIFGVPMGIVLPFSGCRVHTSGLDPFIGEETARLVCRENGTKASETCTILGKKRYDSRTGRGISEIYSKLVQKG
jgi:hypothetical protein